MKKLILIAAITALSACNNTADDTATDTTAMATETAMATPDAAATPMTMADAAGTYDVKAADGSMMTTTINADGTYVDMKDGKETEKGMMAMKDGKTCFTPTGGSETCYTDGPRAADGSWVSTAADGTKVTVMKKPA